MITEALQLLRPNEPFHFENGVPIFENPKVVLPTEAEIEAVEKQLEMKRLAVEKEAEIEKHIYSFYSEKKQAQDEKWTSICMTKLKAAGVADLELKIVQAAGVFFQGKSLTEAVATFDGDKELFTRLVKIAVRTEWGAQCVAEGLAAIKEQRAPKYPDWPGL